MNSQLTYALIGLAEAGEKVVSTYNKYLEQKISHNDLTMKQYLETISPLNNTTEGAQE